MNGHLHVQAEQAFSPAKPEALKVRAKNIPDELRGSPTWVVWEYVWDPAKKRKDGNGEKGDWDKPPLQGCNGKLASTTDPRTQCSFAAALDAYRKGRWDGIGIVLPEGIVGIDLDRCRDPKTAVIEPWAQDIIDALKS
jgi:primase-polymerase (primpol)-like protein